MGPRRRRRDPARLDEPANAVNRSGPSETGLRIHNMLDNAIVMVLA